MRLLDRFRRNKPQPAEQGLLGRVVQYDRDAECGTIALEDGGQVAFETSKCMFTPFVNLPVRVEQTSEAGTRAERVRLTAAAQKDYVKLLEVQAVADQAAAERAGQQERDARRSRLRRRFERIATDPAIEARLEQDPDDLEAYQVYADLLQERGEPLGQLIATEHALAQSADTARRGALQREVARLRAAEEARAGLDPKWARVQWHLGLIEAARVAVNWPDVGDYDEEVDEEMIAGLLTAPAARFVRRLTIGLLSFEPGAGPVFELLEDAGPLTALRELQVADFDYPDEMEMSWYELGADPPPYGALPNLRRLVLQAGQLELGTIDLPRLEHFEVRTGGLRRANIESICAARWPELRTLIVWFGDDNYGAECTIDDVAPILAGQGLERLTTLGLCNAEFTDALCERLPRAPILRQLKVLDLSKGTMRDEGAQALAARREQLAHLERIDVSENMLSDAGIAALQTIGCEIVAAEQRDWDDDYVYVAVGE